MTSMRQRGRVFTGTSSREARKLLWRVTDRILRRHCTRIEAKVSRYGQRVAITEIMEEGTRNVLLADWKRAYKLLDRRYRPTLSAYARLISPLEQVKESLDQLIEDLRLLTVTSQRTGNPHRGIFNGLVSELGLFPSWGYSSERDQETLWVVTEPIVMLREYCGLGPINLGPFRIVLWLPQLLEEEPITVEALEPNPAMVDPEAVHPHVHGDHICLGTAETTVRRLASGFFIGHIFSVVSMVLKSYNDGSPYVPLAKWEGLPCENCGEACSGTTLCAIHEYPLCEDCQVACARCGSITCAVHLCPICEHNVCENCLTVCPNCGENSCRDHMYTCQECHQAACPACMEECHRCGVPR